MKLLVTGHARHGKDTVCGILKAEFGLTFVSSSLFAVEKVARPYLASRGVTYATLKECYADRVNHRKLWHDAIYEYNTPDRTRLARELFSRFDVYCGARNNQEYHTIRGSNLFDVSIWVERLQLPSEDVESMQIRREHCDLILDNSTTVTGLRIRTIDIYHKIVSALR